MKKSSLVILGLLVQFAMQAATPSQIIKEVKQAVAPDGRQVVFEVEMKGNVLRGVTSEPRAREAPASKAKACASPIRYVSIHRTNGPSCAYPSQACAHVGPTPARWPPRP